MMLKLKVLNCFLIFFHLSSLIYSEIKTDLGSIDEKNSILMCQITCVINL